MTRRKALRVAASAAGAAVLLVVLAVALAPRWINLEAVKTRVLAAASSALGGPLKYERIDLAWFPRPVVVLRKLELSIPGTARGTVRSVSVSPQFLPLLRGRVRLSKIRVEGLDLSVDVGAPPKEESPAAPSKAEPLEGLRALVADGGLAASLDGRVVLSRPNRASLAVEGLRIECAARLDGRRTDVTLSRLSAESPRLSAEAALLVDGAVPRAEIRARGEGLDVGIFRGKLLAFAGDVPVLQSIFAFLEGGTLSSWSFSAAGMTAADLGVFEAMSIRAAVAGARVAIPPVRLDLEDVSADVAIDRGVLTAARAAARVGKAKVSDGTVLVALAGNDGRLKVDARFEADLSEIPALLVRVLRSRTVHEELSLLDRIEGRAAGRIVLGDRADDLNVAVRVSKMNFSASHRRIPWPLEVNAGTFFLDGQRLGVSGLSGSVGHSTFSGLEARVRLGREAALERASGSIVASLEDLFGALRSGPGTEPAHVLKRLSGVARADVQRLVGPASRPKDWRFSASGTLEDVLLATSLVPAEVSVKSGAFTLDEREVRVTGLELRALDGALTVSGSLRDYREGAATSEGTVRGTLGPESVGWVWSRAALPAPLRPAAPLELEDVRFGLPRPGAFSFAGGFLVPSGVRVTLDVASQGAVTDVPELTVADGDALASVSIRHAKDALGVRFRGRLDGATVGKLFPEARLRRGRIEGDVRALFPGGRLAGLTADGTLSGMALRVSTPVGEVSIARADVRASGSRLDVTSSSVALGDQDFSIAGSATFRDDRVTLDADVSAADVQWTRVEKALDGTKTKNAGAPASPEASAGTSPPAAAEARGAPPLAIEGVLRFSIGSFGLGKVAFSPVLGEVRLGKGSMAVAVSKADACGISTTGEAQILGDGTFALEARVQSAGPNVNVPLVCLGFDDLRATGRYEASLAVEARGEGSALRRNLHGPVTFKAFQGGIGKANVLTRLLGALNATQLFGGKTRADGTMPYDSISVAADLAEGRLSIREASFVAPAFTMAATGSVGTMDRTLDVQVLSHPLSTVDKVVKAIPVVRTVLGKDFLAVGATVTGTLDDPQIRVTPAKDVGAGLVGILERTVTLPVKVVDPGL